MSDSLTAFTLTAKRVLQRSYLRVFSNTIFSGNRKAASMNGTLCLLGCVGAAKSGPASSGHSLAAAAAAASHAKVQHSFASDGKKTHQGLLLQKC
jgi:hypothetical protein